MPGLGKTAAIVEVVNKLIKEINFQYIYINALKLSSAVGFYTKLWLEISGMDENTQRSCKLLDLYFRSK